MTKAILFYRNSLLTKLFMLVILLVGGGNFLSLSAQKELPYSYGFENNNLATEGWTTSNLQSGSYNSALYSSSYASHTGSYSFRFYSNENPPQYLISPLLAESENAVIVSLYYKNSQSNNTESFCVGYATVSSTPSTSDFTWDTQVDCKSSSYALYEHSFPANTRYIAIKSTTTTASENIGNNYYLMIDDITIEEDNPYKTPTDFALDSFTENTATFSWTAGNSETAWQFAYSTSSDFTPGTGGTTLDITTSDLSNGKYTLTGLTKGTTYYAAIRANYDGGNYSEWTEKISFTPRAEIETTINASASSTSAYNTPFNGNTMHNNLTRSQFIIPSASLSEVNGRQITKITFYTSSSSSYENVDFESAEFEVYLQEVTNATFSSTTMGNWGTKVKNSSTVSVSGHELNITLDTPFNYGGGNLQVGFKQTVKSKKSHYTPWYYVTISNSSRVSTDDGSATIGGYSPKMTITSVPVTTAPVQMGANGFTTFASPYPLDLRTSNMPDGLTAYRAAEVDTENSKVRFTSDINQTVEANTGILLEGTANETYYIPVVASGTALASNDFLVNSTGGTFTADDGYTYFGMKKATSASDALVFATFAPGSVAIPTDKAYLKVLTSSLPATARQLVCSFGDETPTGISATQNDREKTINDEFIYNLNGQRVNKPSKGLYIVNGKKVIIK